MESIITALITGGLTLIEMCIRDSSNIVTITAYDQIRYLKNKDTLVYENKTADGVVALIGEKYGFNIGTLANTVWVIASRVEDNVSLLDMISNALDQTLQNTGDLYIPVSYTHLGQ